MLAHAGCSWFRKISSHSSFPLVIVLLMLSVVAWTQSTTEGAISGTVFDAQGAVVGGATVTVRNVGTNA